MLGYWALALYGFSRRPRDLATVLFGLLTLGDLAFILRTGGDWMNGGRFLVAVLPYITLLQMRGIEALVQSRPANLRRQTAVGVTLLALFALSAGYADFGSALGAWARRGYPLRDDTLLAACTHAYAGTWVTIGHFFRRELRPGVTIAYSEAGYAAYINRDKRFLDTFGLTDHEIAHVHGVDRCWFGVVTMFWNPPSDPVQRILRRRAPDYVVIGSVAMPQPMPIPDKWRDALAQTGFGFYQRRPDLPVANVR